MTTDPWAAPATLELPPWPTPKRAPYPTPPAWLPVAALGAGAVAAVAVPGHPLGSLGTVLAIAAVAGALVAAVRRSMTAADVLLGGLLVALLLMFVLRDAGWLLALNLVAVAGLGTSVVAGARRWNSLVAAGITLWARLAPALPYLLRPLAQRGRGAAPRLRPALRGGVLAAALLLVFGGLFASADAAFATFAGRAIPSLGLSLLPLRVLVGAFAMALVGAGLLTALRPLRPVTLPAPGQRSRAEWLLPLVVLNALFAAFVAVQLAVLFGGQDHVLRTSGLTYAQYARQGFFQLLAVVALTLLVVAVVVNRVPLAAAQDRTYARAALGALCTLTFVVLASAWRRLTLYEEVYGLTRLRLFVHAVMVGLGLVLLLVVAAGVRWRGGWLPRACLAVAAVSLLGLNVANPDALIAHRAVSTGRVDPAYLSTLSADAAPALRPLGICVQVPARTSWLAWNLSRARATAGARNC